MIAAIITAYKPDSEFKSRFLPLLSVCGAIIVIDNTPGGHQNFDLPDGSILWQNLRNLGLGPALNIGLRVAADSGAQHVILFDQDSTPDADFILAMKRSLDEAISLWGIKCCVGPTHIDDAAPLTLIDNRPPAQEDRDEMSIVTCLPTSGMIFPLASVGPDDRFTDEFFLDLVDFEWCWRLRARGWQFLRDPRVVMLHRLGIAQRKLLGLTFHVPAPYRHYFQVRDTLRLAAKDYVPLYSKWRLIGILPLKAVVYPFLLDSGLERLRWMWRGLIDAVRNVRGVGAAAARLSQ